MQDIDALIKKILSGLSEKLSARDKVYTDEPILRPASRMNNYLPPKYAEMKALARSNSSCVCESEAAVFYRQAVFMAEHEDNCPYDEPFLRYFPTYRSLTDRQLRGYFTWRTKVRQGVVQKTALSFVFIYIYELLCLVGVSSPEEGFDTLAAFWHTYREIDAAIDRYVTNWLTDFYVYYRPDRPTDELCLGDALDEALAILQAPDESDSAALYEALCRLSSYRLERSKFTKAYPDEMQTVVCRVYRRFAEHYDERCRNSLFIKLFGAGESRAYRLFDAAVFHDPAPHADDEVVLTPMLRFVHKDGTWYRQTGCARRAKSRELGNLLKAVDVAMRQAYGWQTSLQAPPTTKLLSKLIAREIAMFREEARRTQRPVIAIDRTKLSGIRRSAAVTCERLLAEATLDETPPPPPSPPPPPPPSAAYPTLSDEESGLLARLLYGGDVYGFLRERRQMLSVLVDGINEKLFDTFGDTVIDFDGDTPMVIDDYIDQLKGRSSP